MEKMSRFLATRLSVYIILKMTSIEEENLTEIHTHKSPNNEKKRQKNHHHNLDLNVSLLTNRLSRNLQRILEIHIINTHEARSPGFFL